MEKKKIIRTGFMTEIDRFLRDFDTYRQDYPESRVKEVAKYKKIYEKRDKVETDDKQSIWKEF